MREHMDKESRRKYSGLRPTDNPHKFDEMPKNRPSKYITTRCGNVEWLQEPTSFGGHKIRREGHRMVSGIVRAKIKEEIRKDIENSQD